MLYELIYHIALPLKIIILPHKMPQALSIAILIQKYWDIDTVVIILPL